VAGVLDAWWRLGLRMAVMSSNSRENVLACLRANGAQDYFEFLFFTNSLYEQVRGLGETFYREMTGEAPDWQKVEVRHAWGNKSQKGFYSSLAGKPT
jgi:superfamily I DNA and RNA helicase